jgi:isoleucyl-tRNA synthetase
MDYKATLNLLKTAFPMKANLPEREPETLAWWDEIDIYRLVRENRAGAPKYVLHDGPPYANGNIHLGQALNKILKDVAIKFRTMRGYDCPYIPGWDTQGLPTEQSVQKEYGINRHSVTPLEWRGKCRDLAMRYVNLQREQFRRLGVRGDWCNPYLTLSPEYQARQIDAFAKIALRGLVYRRLRPVYWCYHCETALAEDEIEYATKTSPSIYVAFELRDAQAAFPELPAEAKASVIIWTTTPWTIPGNTGIALSADDNYVLFRAGDAYYFVAEPLLGATAKAVGFGAPEIIARRKGRDLENRIAVHPLYGRDSRIVLADYVLMDQGTGCVHTAPGHGLEDYMTAMKYSLDVISPLDDYGKYTDEAGPELAGLVCDQANEKVKAMLAERGALLGAGTIDHEYPHCWRCHFPVIYRATKQWFMDIAKLREAALKEIEGVTWEPSWGGRRIAGMVEARPDWCISRQRVWGVPIPVFHCVKCDEMLMTEESMGAVRDLVAQCGADVWYEREPKDILPPGTACKCGSTEFRKEADIMSVWFDSGCSHYAVLRAHDELTYPADLYLEGDDQYQCWFQTSLWVAVALGDPAPFKTVVGHAFFVDDTGEKLSKSKGNIIDPAVIYEKYGADVLRMWFTYADFRRKMFASDQIYEQVADAYRRIRNTCRFMLQNLADFDPQKDRVPYAEMREVDKWALSRLNWLVDRMTKAFDDWDWHLFYHDVHGFCATDLSAFYLDVLKDTLYTDLPDSTARRSAQTALWELLIAITKIMAPVLTYTADEIWKYCRELDGTLPLSVHLADWPTVDLRWQDEALASRWEGILGVRDEVLAALERAKNGGVVERPLDAQVDIYASESLRAALAAVSDDLAGLLIVSGVRVLADSERPEGLEQASESAPEGVWVAISPAAGEKCGRCWMRQETVGANDGHPTLCARCADRVTKLKPSES